uniref:KIB1-4 beta-propeller domain-containing protein n=1 Tax=Setaria viridis TaxID=4556 RepID=A0A4U6WCQ6_SETVI|nr:hypothetical protein SEVIR_2G383900v2 [Setaria viridis]
MVLLSKLLGRIAACCPKPTDRTSFHAVCHSWHFAVCHNCPRTPLLQWVVPCDGSFLTLSDDGRDLPQGTVRYSEFVHPAHGLCSLALPDPENTAYDSSMGGWLALCHRDRWSLRANDYSFVLHNPFSDTIVLLPDVNGVGSIALPGVFDALKVLMHSTAKDIVASSPIAGVIRYPYPSVNVTFLGDKLYGITKVEDLFSFDLALLHPLDKQDYDYVPWSDVDDEEDQENNDDDGDDKLASISGENTNVADENSEENQHRNTSSMEVSSTQGIGMNGTDAGDEEPPHAEITVRYLVDANGKLIMVRRQLQFHVPGPKHTGKVEVFEADTGAGAWVPVDGGGLGGGGQALFISQRFSKCDAIDFVDTGEAFGMRSGAIRPALWCLDFCSPTWVFPPDL